MKDGDDPAIESPSRMRLFRRSELEIGGPPPPHVIKTGIGHSVLCEQNTTRSFVESKFVAKRLIA